MASLDLSRLKQLFRRAAAGEELTLGFFGGSITQGSLAAEQGNCYAFRVYRWFVDTFPGAAFHYVNGGIGGTDSFYGVARAVTDLLQYQPDFVVVDFSVNDTKLPFRKETYEGLLRKVLAWPSRPAVVLPSFMLQPNSRDSTTPICDLPSPPLPLMTIMRCPLLLGIRQ